MFPFPRSPLLLPGVPWLFHGGFPHSDISGSPGVRPFPRAFRRRTTSFIGSTAPGHPPSAFIGLRPSRPRSCEPRSCPRRPIFRWDRVRPVPPRSPLSAGRRATDRPDPSRPSPTATHLCVRVFFRSSLYLVTCLASIHPEHSRWKPRPPTTGSDPIVTTTGARRTVEMRGFEPRTSSVQGRRSPS